MTTTKTKPSIEKIVTLDFETYFDKDYSLNKLNTQEYVADPKFKVWGVGIKLDGDQTEWFGEDDAEEALHDIDWDNATLVCHNTLFDGYILAEEYGIYPKFYCDTAAMARGLEPQKSASLRAVAKRTFPDDETMRKGEELASAKGVYDLSHALEQDIAGYCVQDVDLTHAIFQKIFSDYPKSELNLIHLTTKMFCQPELVLDTDRIESLLNHIRDCTEGTIAASGIAREVLSSNAKFSEHLKSIGITPPTKRSPTSGLQIPAFGKNDYGWKQLVAMYPEHKHIWEARIAVKSRLDETRAARFLNSINHNGYMPVPLRYYAAHTGRFGGTEKINLQNLPRDSELRRCLTAPEGKFVYVADLSNIEARMLAWIAQEDKLLNAFSANEDVYCQFASKIYGKKINKYDHPDERFVGKTAVLGLGYGMGKDKFGETLTRSNIKYEPDLPEQVVSTYRSTYAMIREYWGVAKSMLFAMCDKTQWGNTVGLLQIERHALVLPNNMRLTYPNLEFNSHNNEFTFEGQKTIERTYGGRLTENIVQALSRIVITDAMLRLETNLKPLGGTVVHTVHDEILIVAPQESPDVMLDLLIDQMCIPPAWATGIPLAAEGDYGVAYAK